MIYRKLLGTLLKISIILIQIVSHDGAFARVNNQPHK